MKLITLALLACLLCGQVMASDNWENPNKLKIIERDQYGVLTIMLAWQNTTSGMWTLAYVDSNTGNAKLFFGNETGWVKIT